MAKRFTWRKQPLPTGLAAMAAAGRPRSLELSYDGERRAVVSFDRNTGRWYWYSLCDELRHNSLWDGVSWKTPEEAKADCLARFRGVMAKRE